MKQNNEKNLSLNEYELSPVELEMLQSYESAMRDIQSQLQGALRMIAKQQKLEGQWNMVGNKLVKESPVINSGNAQQS